MEGLNIFCLLLIVFQANSVESWSWTTYNWWDETTDLPSCRYNCGYNPGSCSCTHECWRYGNCCPDYYNFCYSTTEWPTTGDTTSGWEETTGDPSYAHSCRNNCGTYFGRCSCSYYCRQNGNCCYDFNDYCSVEWTTHWPDTTGLPSCRYNCGYNHGSCSCTHDCWRYGNCCPDYDNFCYSTTEWPTTVETTPGITVDEASCRNHCGELLPICGCDDNCQQHRDCCPDFNIYCPATTHDSTPTADWGTTEDHWTTADNPSCMYNCGFTFSTCSCAYDCRHRGNCCYDFDWYCPQSTVADTTGFPSCMYNCGHNFSSCSCNYDCWHRGNCCPDFDWYCPRYTTPPEITATHPQCGGHLYGSGMFSSPNYPYYYHDNAYCVWYLSAQQGQRIFLSFTDVQLERCCDCDYITVHDGSSTGHRQLGKVCFNDTTHQTFHSSSRYLTVVFRSDYSGVSHGFKALFTSSLTADQGRVDCSSDNMVIVIQKSYLNSLGFSGNDLYVDNHLCRPTFSSNEVVFRFPLDTCGTAKEMMNGYVSYANNVRASPSQAGEITRQSQFLLHVGCRMEPDTMVQILYRAKEDTNANITGTGRFNASIAFFTSSSFRYQIYDSPYEVNLNQPMYVQVELDRSDSSLDLFLDACVASPNPNDFKDRSYDLLRNGCPKDSTVSIYRNGHNYYAQFSFRAFMFLRTHAFVYLQCKVIICPNNDSNSRCRQGCRLRRRRSVDSTYHSRTVTLGPIRLKGGRHGVMESESKE